MPAAAVELTTARLILEPLRETHATEMLEVLADPELYEFMGGCAPTFDQLRSRYQRQIAGSIDGREVWANWILREIDTGRPAGFVQATILADTADVAWLVGREFQGRGFGAEASAAMIAWLHSTGVRQITAHIHPEHAASQHIAAAIGLSLTDRLDVDGEELWC